MNVGLVGRFKPLHKGGAVLLENICKNADHAIIGIGSANKYDARNPFTPEETADMINLYLKPRYNNYDIIFIPDFGHKYGEGVWEKYVVEKMHNIYYFVTGNPYVKKLMEQHYKVITPEEMIPKDQYIPMKATIVRHAMANNNGYRHMLPEVVANYIEKNNLAERFRKEFGEQLQNQKITHKESLESEMMNVLGK